MQIRAPWKTQPFRKTFSLRLGEAYSPTATPEVLVTGVGKGWCHGLIRSELPAQKLKRKAAQSIREEHSPAHAPTSDFPPWSCEGVVVSACFKPCSLRSQTQAAHSCSVRTTERVKRPLTPPMLSCQPCQAPRGSCVLTRASSLSRKFQNRPRGTDKGTKAPRGSSPQVPLHSCKKQSPRPDWSRGCVHPRPRCHTKLQGRKRVAWARLPEAAVTTVPRLLMDARTSRCIQAWPGRLSRQGHCGVSVETEKRDSAGWKALAATHSSLPAHVEAAERPLRCPATGQPSALFT